MILKTKIQYHTVTSGAPICEWLHYLIDKADINFVSPRQRATEDFSSYPSHLVSMVGINSNIQEKQMKREIKGDKKRGNNYKT